jgi:hypothetical protein
MAFNLGQVWGKQRRLDTRLACFNRRGVVQGQEPNLHQTLQQLPAVGLEFATLILAFTLAIFVLLVFGVRVLMVVRKLPVPLDPFDMAKPRSFRTMMLGFSVILAPLVAQGFLPTAGMDRGWALALSYALAAVVAVLAWLLLELFYGLRGR